MQLTDPWMARRVLTTYPRDLTWLRRVQRASHAMKEQNILDPHEANILYLDAQRLINKQLNRMRARVV